MSFIRNKRRASTGFVIKKSSELSRLVRTSFASKPHRWFTTSSKAMRRVFPTSRCVKANDRMSRIRLRRATNFDAGHNSPCVLVCMMTRNSCEDVSIALIIPIPMSSVPICSSALSGAPCRGKWDGFLNIEIKVGDLVVITSRCYNLRQHAIDKIHHQDFTSSFTMFSIVFCCSSDGGKASATPCRGDPPNDVGDPPKDRSVREEGVIKS